MQISYAQVQEITSSKFDTVIIPCSCYIVKTFINIQIYQ